MKTELYIDGQFQTFEVNVSRIEAKAACTIANGKKAIIRYWGASEVWKYSVGLFRAENDCEAFTVYKAKNRDDAAAYAAEWLHCGRI